MSTTPARFLDAGADKKPVNSDLPAYDFSFREPVNVSVSVNRHDTLIKRPDLGEVQQFQRTAQGQVRAQKGRLT